MSFYGRYLSRHFLSINKPPRNGNLIRYYNEMSSCYKHWYGKFLPANKKARIMDLGCGMGHFLYFLLKEGYENILGIDISSEQVLFVRKYITDKVLTCDAIKFLEETDAKFDLIVLNDVLEHIPKHRISYLLALIHRTLTEDGKVFIKTVNASNPFNLRGRYMDFTHEIAFTEHSLTQVLKEAGFEIITIYGATCPRKGLRGLLESFARKVFFIIMKKLFYLQGIPPPQILDKDLIAIAAKRRV